MLTEGDRAQLAPHLMTLHAARATLVRARQEAARARRHAAEFKRDTTPWDRWFNRDGPTGLAYREARRVRGETEAAVAERLAEVKTLEDRLDRRIEPMMPQLDPHYEAAAPVIEKSAVAAQERRAARNPMHTLIETVRDATRNGRDEKAASGARLRYPTHLTHARTAAARVKRALTPVRIALADAGGVVRVPASKSKPATLGLHCSLRR
jgi:hypothetical protein